MLPNKEFIVIENNIELISKFIEQVIASPKKMLKDWSKITNQTPAIKLGYVGQHLASLITGVQGTGSGARGDDLADGSEVKSCNKVDQADKCKDCGHRVLRYENKCPNCGSINIERKDDSKWLFSVRDEHELQQYLKMDRIVLILMDYSKFAINDFNDIRILCFEIYPKEPRMKVFSDLIKNHYYNIYLKKVKANKKTNPMNFHPWSFQFYKCNPIKTFECIIENIDTNPVIKIDKNAYVSPEKARDESMPTIPMPSSILNDKEWKEMTKKASYENDILPLLKKEITKTEFRKLNKKEKENILPFISEKLRGYIPLREITSVTQSTHYQR